MTGVVSQTKWTGYEGPSTVLKRLAEICTWNPGCSQVETLDQVYQGRPMIEEYLGI